MQIKKYIINDKKQTRIQTQWWGNS
jgi:hypothetical protein